MKVLDDSELARVESIRDKGPYQLRDRMTSAFRWDEPAKAQVDHLTSLVEKLCLYLCEIYNSYYFEIDDTVEELESKLRELETRRHRLSFGNYNGALRVFTGYFGGQECESVPELRLLGRSSLPEAVSLFCKKIDLAKEGREFHIPAQAIDDYVEKRMKGQAAKSLGFVEFVNYIIQIRNAHAHPEGKPWWIEDKKWYKWLNEELQIAVKDAIVWKPIKNILLKYCLVENQQNARNGSARDQWEVMFKSVGEAKFEYTLSPRRVTIDTGSVAGGEPPNKFYVLANSDKKGYDYQFEHITFPDKKVSQQERKQNYRRKYIQTYLGVGIIDETARDELAVYQEREALSNDEAKNLQKEVQNKLNKIRNAETEEEQDELILELRSSIGDENKKHMPGLEEQIETLDEKIRDAILQKVEDVAVVSHGQLMEDIGFSEEVLANVLEPLEDDIYSFEGLGGEKLYSSALVSPISTFEEMVEKLMSTEFSLEEVSRKRLLKISYDLLPDRSREIREWFDETFTTTDSQESGTTDAEEQQDSLELVVDGEKIVGDSTPDFFDKIFEAFSSDPRFQEGIPHRMGRTRYLVHWENRHKNGTEFYHEVSCGDPENRVYFEANITRWKAQIEAEKFLSSCGFSVSSSLEVAIEGDAESTEEDSSGDDSLESMKNKLMIEVHDLGRRDEIVGSTVGALFAELLKYIDKEGLLDGKLDALPVYAGRVRYLLADKPVHANERKFRRVVDRDIEMENGDVVEAYMEAAFSREAGLDKGIELLNELGIRDVEGVDWRNKLRVSIDGEETTGNTVRKFIRAVVDSLEKLEVDWKDHVPYSMGTQRYLVNEEPIHDDGDEFTTIEEIDEHYFEVNLSYDATRSAISKWLDEMGLEHDLEV